MFILDLKTAGLAGFGVLENLMLPLRFSVFAGSKMTIVNNLDALIFFDFKYCDLPEG